MFVPLISRLTGLKSAVWQLTIFVFISKTDQSKPVKQEVNGTVILPPLVFLGIRKSKGILSLASKCVRYWTKPKHVSNINMKLKQNHNFGLKIFSIVGFNWSFCIKCSCPVAICAQEVLIFSLFPTHYPFLTNVQNLQQ